MRKKGLLLGVLVLLASTLQLSAATAAQDSTYRRWFVGSSLLMFGNFSQVNNPEYVQLNAGYRITPKDVVSVEFKRSIYSWPIGIPFGPSFDAPGLNYPGHARILAPTVGYQRFWWKGVYTSLHALNAFEKYLDAYRKRIGNGFTLYLNFHVGYQFRFWENRIFFEPALGCSYWPVRTNVPAAFKVAERAWPNYFIQPGLHFGFNF